MVNQQKNQLKTLPLKFLTLKKNPINLVLTVGSLYEKTKLKLIRFYICTKEKPHLSECSSEEDECHVDISDERMTDTQLRKRYLMFTY